VNRPRIAPSVIRDYVRAHGWHEVAEARGHGVFLLNAPNGSRRQISVPIDEEAADYQESLEYAIERLAKYEERTVEGLRDRLLSASDDLFRLRVASAVDDSTILFTYATEVLGSTQRLLQAAACTVLEPKIHHARVDRGEARQLVDALRFRHTQFGSFVLNLSCPVNAVEAGGPNGDQRSPFVRRTMRVVLEGMQSLVMAVQTDTVDRLVAELRASNAPQISDNFCDALLRLRPDDRSSLEIQMEWALILPEPDGERRTVRIPRDYFAHIQDVRDALRPVDEVETDSYVATVEQLEGEMGVDGRRSGRVELRLFLPEGESVRAVTRLTADQYEQAISAHRVHGSLVRVAGRLLSGKQPRTLDDLADFEVIPPRR